MPGRDALVRAQRFCVQHKRSGARIQQAAGQAGGIATVVAAAHEQPDSLSGKMRAVGAQCLKGRAGRIFHQQDFRQAQAHGCGVPGPHFGGQGQGREKVYKVGKTAHHASRITTATTTLRS